MASRERRDNANETDSPKVGGGGSLVRSPARPRPRARDPKGASRLTLKWRPPRKRPVIPWMQIRMQMRMGMQMQNGIIVIMFIQFIIGLLPLSCVKCAQQQQQSQTQLQSKLGTQSQASSAHPHQVLSSREIEKQIVDKILGEGYDKRIRPAGVTNGSSPTGSDGPTIVQVNTLVRSISKIDDVTMEYYVQLSLRQEWIDDRLAYGKMAQYSNYGLNSITLTEQERIWKPDLFFRNEKEGHFHKIILPNVLLRINGDGQVLYSIRISLVLACPMDLKYYPLDKQNCTIEMASYGYLDEDLKFVWKRENPVQIQKPLNLPRFTLETHETAYCTSRTTTGAYSCLRIDLIFKREFSYYLIQIYIPCCMLVIVSWVSFWLDPNAIPARVSLGVTTLLTMATQISGINASLPPVSYTKAIDVWTGVCLTFVFSALLEFALVNYASRSDQHKREMLTSALTYTQKMRWREATAAAAAAGVAPPTSPPPDENSPSAYTCTPKAPPNQIQATQPQGQATTSTSVTSAHHSANNANNTHFLFPDSQQQQHPAHLALGGPHPTSCNVGGQYQCAAFPRQAARTSGGAPASLHSQQQHPLGVCATVDAAGLAATHPPNGPPCLAPVRPYGLAHGQQTNNSSNRNQQQQRNFVPQTTQQPDSNKQPARSRAKSILSLVGFSRQRAPRAGGDPSSTNQHHPSHRSSWSSRPQSSKQRANSNQMLAGPQCPLHYQPQPDPKQKNFCLIWLRKFPTRSKRIDVISRIFFPLKFALFNLVYWTTYLFREDETMA